jgi:uncharacterized protein (UPF0248 family)
MQPIHELLNRIRWDKEFGKGSFEIGYADHIQQRIIRVPFQKMRFMEGDRFSFQVEDSEGETLTIPFHRVREVYKNGYRIWYRSF